MVSISGGGSCHHTELQELQPGDAGCVRVRLRGGAWQCWHWSRESAGKVRLRQTPQQLLSSMFKSQSVNFTSGSVVPPSLLTWPPPGPTWLLCLWLTREWPTAASMQHTGPYLCWTVSSFQFLVLFPPVFYFPPLFHFLSQLSTHPFSFWPTLNIWHFYMLLHLNTFFLSLYLFHLVPHDSLWPPPLWLPLYCKGRVVRVSLPAAQGSVFSSSGCAMDGTTALTVQMNRVVATPPTLHSVSLISLTSIRVPLDRHRKSRFVQQNCHPEQQKQSLLGHFLIYLGNQKLEVGVLWMQNIWESASV